MKKLLLIATTFLLVATSQADPIGKVTFAGTFTTNHLFDLNDPSLEPFGTFGLQTVVNSTGIFAGHVHAGEILQGAGILNTVNNLPIFTLPGLTFITQNGVLLSGGMAGFSVSADVNILGLTLPFNSAILFFSAPALDPTQDVTGPIAFEFRAFNNRFATPDGGTTVALMGLSLIALGVVRRYA
jgi:VPDSG-CTERM motif